MLSLLLRARKVWVVMDCKWIGRNFSFGVGKMVDDTLGVLFVELHGEAFGRCFWIV